MKVSTISIAEYCVVGKIDELPLKNIQIIPFNLDHAKITGSFANALFKNKANLSPRAIIPNDAKLFAQADLDKTISHYVTSDTRSLKTFPYLSKEKSPKFQIIDINAPYNETFGVLDL